MSILYKNGRNVRFVLFRKYLITNVVKYRTYWSPQLHRLIYHGNSSAQLIHRSNKMREVAIVTEVLLSC